MTMQIVDLEIELVDLPYEVTRKLTVPTIIALTDLHLVLQAAMGWDSSHMFDFACGTGRKMHRWYKIDPDWGSDAFGHEIAKATLADVMALMGKAKSLLYAYDMGDNWEHDLMPGKPREAAPGEAVIALHAAVGACPPDDSGGSPGFEDKLAILDDPTHEEHEDVLDWMGGPFDRTADVVLLTKRVAAVAKKLAKRYPL